jgi:CheY-like chemotaxis protein
VGVDGCGWPYSDRFTTRKTTTDTAVRDHQPDVVLLDVQLPDGDGFQVCEELARGSASTPPDASDAPVTTTVTRRVKPGHEVFYEQFREGIISAASRFPGHLGVEVFRPQSAAAGEYRIVYPAHRPPPPTQHTSP